ncbi:PREDICTED: uncharacterized protein LOC109217187 [Nicotiana attenuata]|uniref:uncharacterized protein LOC109217187 n=1 Tax=Nicotiana attenuata TaxID=49451 RepID=UPI000904D068|nr:PREDICTED: uncharacterized protein LOC109217187 [Nicotiana attenuata]
MDHRKRNNASKVYVVFRGKRPGLYNSWHRCAPMVIGVKGSIFKAFKTYDEAIAAFNEFRNGSQTDNISASKVYVVFRGKKPGLYNSCEEQSSNSCVDESAMSSVLLAGMFVGMKISKNCSV